MQIIRNFVRLTHAVVEVNVEKLLKSNTNIDTNSFMASTAYETIIKIGSPLCVAVFFSVTMQLTNRSTE